MRVLPLPLMLVFLLGCENPFLSDPSGSFTATVTGAISTSLEGGAIIAKQSATVSDDYAISLVAQGGRAIYFFSRSRPQAGMYSVVPFVTDTPRDGFTAAFFSERNGGVFDSVGGELRIVSTSGGGLQGTFNFEAEDRPERPRVTISGTFNVE